jgi:hypothetical protein
MKDVFISYNHKDQAVKDWLCEILTKTNIDYSVDSNDLEFGKDIAQGIEECIDNSRTTLMIVSPNSLFSTWVGMEAMYRLRQEKGGKVPSLICIVTDNVVLELEFPLRIQEEFNSLEKKLETLRSQMLSLGGSGEVFEKEINRLKQIRVGDLMIKVRSHLMVQYGNEKTRNLEMEKLIAVIKDARRVSPSSSPPKTEAGVDSANSHGSKRHVMPDIEGVNWEGLKNAILNEKAILCIGPEVTVNFKDSRAQMKFFTDLAYRHPSGTMGIKTYHERDGLLIFNDPDKGRSGHENAIRQFYKQDFTSGMLDKLADIPFRMIISASPDDSFLKCCKIKTDYVVHMYPNRPTQVDPSISRKSPLLYSLLGTVENGRGMVYSHEALFDLMERVIRQKCLKGAINFAFPYSDYTHVVFLGFDFEKWYFQLILKELLHQPRVLNSHGSNQGPLHNHTQSLFDAHFQIAFVSANIPEFVEYLYGLFLPSQLRRS